MKLYFIRTLLFISIFTLTHQAFSQSNGGKIVGVVYNPDKLPAEFSTAVLMNRDSVFLGGTMTTNDGSFSLDKLKPGSYMVMIRNVEFQTYISDLIKINADETISLDKITLRSKTTALDEVVVKGEKAIVEMHPDKMVFNVANSISASGNNGLELLAKSPGVLVDLDKNISLQGKSGVKIYINGRPSRLSGSDLSNMLESMRSDNIESIEIIANPSAKYEAEGAGGIINIVLKKNASAGFNGNINGTYSKGLYARQSGGTNLNYSSGKVNVFTSLSLSDEDRIDNFEQTNQQGDYHLDMESNSMIDRKALNFSGGMDYSINNENTLSIDARIMLNDMADETQSINIIENNVQTLPTEVLKSGAYVYGNSNNYNANAHYSFIPNRSSSFTADLSYALYANSSKTSQPNAYYNADESALLRTQESEFTNNTDIGLFSVMADYEKKWSKLTLSTGAKYSHIQTGNYLSFYDIVDETKLKNDNRSNDFSYLEEIAAAYLILDAKPSENFTVNAGLRVENTASLGELLSAVPTNNDVVARNYTSYFPNIGLSYTDQKNHAIGISVGRRIGRPNYQYLNPFESVISAISSWKGNPFLKPNYITNYQVNYSFKRKLVISNTYSITRDFFATIFEVTGDQSSVLIPRNMERVINNGLSISYPQKVTNWWQFAAFVIYNHEKYDGDIEGTIIDLTADVYSLSMQNSLKLPLNIAMDVSYYFRSPWIWRGTIYVKEFHQLNIGVKREFLKNKLQVQLTANDILRTSSDYYYNSNYGGMIIDGVRKFDNRRYGINVSYKFGNQKNKTSRKKSAIDEELERIAE